VGEWIKGTLGDLIELKRGYDLPQQKRSAGGVPIVSSSGVSDHHSTYMVRGPGVVTGRYGTIGQIFYIEQDFWPLNTTLYVRDFKGNDPRFVSYFLRMVDFLAYSDKAAVPGLNRNHLHTASIRYPKEKSEQIAISSVLAALDDKIELNRRMNETLEAMARAIFRDWFVDFGPTCAKQEGREPYLAPEIWSLFPDRFDNEGKPEGWGTSAIKSLCSRIANGGTPKREMLGYWDGGTIPWLTSGEVRKPYLVGTENFITEAGFANSSAKWVPADSTVVALYGATAGQVAYVAVPLTTNQAVCALTPVPYRRYFNYLALSSATQTLFGMARGSAQQNLSKGLVEDLPFVVGNTELYKHFDFVMEPLFQRIVANELESRTLAETRDLLLPKLMSGEIRVRAAEKLVEDAA
jgi:type I restriction enzyme S subunit